MKAGRWKSIGCCYLAAALGMYATGAQAEVFFGGDTKGMPGESVEMSINARGGTTIEAIQIVPEYAPVADVLELIGLTSTPALMDGGFGDCSSGTVCAVVYVNGKSFASDTVLATVRFTIAADAVPGPVPFDAGVIVGEAVIPIPPAQNFEVLAIPEPAHWALLTTGLVVILAVARRRRA